MILDNLYADTFLPVERTSPLGMTTSIGTLRRQGYAAQRQPGLHEALEQQKIPHTWHLESGAHTFAVWRNDLYLFAQHLFRDK